MAPKISTSENHRKEALKFCKDAVFALTQNDPKDMQTVVYILENAIDEVQIAIKLHNQGK